HLLDQHRPLGGREGEQLSGVPLQNHHGPAGKVLIVVEVGDGLAEVGDTLLGAWPVAGAGRTARRRHRHSSRKRPTRRSPSSMRSSDAAYENRTYPSALPPNAIPGVTTTWQRSSSSMANRNESDVNRRALAST